MTGVTNFAIESGMTLAVHRIWQCVLALKQNQMKIGIIPNLDTNFDTQEFTDAPVMATQNHKMCYSISFISVEQLEIQNMIKHISYYQRFLKNTTME